MSFLDSFLSLKIVFRSGNKSTLNLTDPSGDGGDGEEEVTTYQVTIAHMNHSA